MITGGQSFFGRLWWVGIPLVALAAGWMRLSLESRAAVAADPAVLVASNARTDKSEPAAAELRQIAQGAIDFEDAEMLLREPLERLDFTGVVAILDHLVDHGSRAGCDYFLATAAFRRLSTLDPFHAVEWVRDRGFPLSLHTVVEIPLRAMAAADPDRTLRVLKTFPNTQLQDTSAEVCIGALAETHPETAWKMISDVIRPEARSSTLSELPPAVALNLVKDRQCSGREEIVFYVLQKMSRSDPEAALRAFKESRLPMEYQSRWIEHLAVDPEVKLSKTDLSALMQTVNNPTVTAGLVSQLWKADTEGAWQAVTALPDGPAKEMARSKLIYEEALRDPATLNTRLPEIASQPVADTMVRQVFSQLAVNDPQAAVASANLLTEPTARDSALTGACLQWSWRNPGELMGYLEENLAFDIPAVVLTAVSPHLFTANFERAAGIVQKAPAPLRVAAAQAAAAQSRRFTPAERARLARLASDPPQ